MTKLRSDHRTISPLFRFILVPVALALVCFAIGPQAGSIDVNGDGVPEVPVIVVGPDSAGDAFSAFQDEDHFAAVTMAVRCVQLDTDALNPQREDSAHLAWPDTRWMRQPCLLRC